MMKKKYVTPTIKAVEWNFQQPICNAVYQQSPCIIIDQAEPQTRVDHIHSFENGTLGGWNETPGAWPGR